MVQTKEERAEYERQYNIKHKEKRNADSREYYLKNKEEIKIKKKEYNDEHKEERSEKQKLYRKTEGGLKCEKTGRWKSRGLKGDIDEIYERYKNTEECDNCGIKLTVGGINKCNTKVMDHSHITGEFRNILCLSCNSSRR
mgnify:FL=1|tara:strand:+ start:508 stop:927 length:420 start_codon:yes stop_codon:yes gene_type:complete